MDNNIFIPKNSLVKIFYENGCAVILNNIIGSDITLRPEETVTILVEDCLNITLTPEKVYINNLPLSRNDNNSWTLKNIPISKKDENTSCQCSIMVLMSSGCVCGGV